ncbi:Negative regulator of mitotic exit [Entomophthora muscae]|uniref:Negative regulator of mitotic exit n=1 Tax=Entomophthora muscae TaxID=34485 RepID=A0ACC2SJJ1_9FUNG|nr:Negative regulator of mitotic exit [Entomophthora muscae]
MDSCLAGFKASRMNLLVISVLLTGAVGKEIPGVYGLGCASVGSKLYAFGGSMAAGEKRPNRKVFSLDLARPNSPAWKSTPLTIPYDAMYPGVAALNSTHLMIIGGKKVSIEEGFYSFNPAANQDSFSPMPPPNQFKLAGSDSDLLYFPYAGGFMQISKNQYLFYGGFQFKNDLSDASFVNFMHRFDSSTNQWSDDNPQGGPNTYFQSGNIYKNNLYVLGGLDAKDRIQSLAQGWKYDPKLKVWSKFTTKGIDPGNRSHHSAVVVDNLLYVVGGQNIKSINGRIDVLDLDNLTWSTRKVPGLMGKLQGCLNHHEGKLFYSFGFSDPFTSSSVAIDLKSFEISSSDGAAPKTHAPEEPTPISVVIGITVGCILGVFAIVFLVLLARRVKQIHNQNVEHQIVYNRQLDEYNQIVSNNPIEPLPPVEEVPFPMVDGMLGSAPSTVTTHYISSIYPTSFTAGNFSNIEIPKEWSSTPK